MGLLAFIKQPFIIIMKKQTTKTIKATEENHEIELNIDEGGVLINELTNPENKIYLYPSQIKEFIKIMRFEDE